MFPLDELVEFQKLTTKEKIRSLIEIIGHALMVKDVQPLGRTNRKDMPELISDAQKALARRQRKRKYSILRSSAILSIALLTSLFILTELVPRYLAQLGFGWVTLIWIISIVIFTLAGWSILNEEFKKLDALFLHRLLFEEKKRVQSENRLKKIIILERKLRDIKKDEVNNWLDEIFDQKKKEVIDQINKDLIKLELPPIDTYNFDDVDIAKRMAKEDLIFFLIVYKPIRKILQIIPQEIVTKVKSRKFEEEARKRLVTI